jgi:hypothetical protein
MHLDQQLVDALPCFGRDSRDCVALRTFYVDLHHYPSAGDSVESEVDI